MDDHDQRFKTLLREFLPEFFELFFADWAPRFDFSGTEWLEQEAFLDPPGGEKRVLDVVAKVPTHGMSGLSTRHAILHIEIESAGGVSDMPARMYEYYSHLRRRHDLPVLPVALYLRVGRDGVGREAYEDRLPGWTVVRFEYLYVGLPKVDATPYLTGTNPLGIALAGLMHLPPGDRAAMKLAAVKRVRELAGSEYRAMLLVDCIEAYWPLTDEERTEYARLLQADENREVREMITMWDIRVMRQILRKQVEKKFGPLSPMAAARLEAIPSDRLEQALENVVVAKSLDELGLGDTPATPPEGN